MFIVANKGFYFYGKLKELRKYLNELSTEYSTVTQFTQSKLH